MVITKRRVPGLLKHSSGQARVCLSGRFHYCGVHGTAAAAQKYAALLAQWEANGRKPIDPAPDAGELRPVSELLALYENYLDTSGRYRKEGRETSHRSNIRVAVREFVDKFGNTPAADYNETVLLRHRDVLETRASLTRSGINRKVGMLRAAFKWMFGRSLLTRDQWIGTSAVEPLSRAEAGGRDRKRSKRAVSMEDVERVAACLPRVTAAMLRLQALAGLRPGEVCRLRWRDIDKTPVMVGKVKCWTYRVAGAKTEHHGHATTYAFAPKAQAILEQFLADPDEFIFSPRRTMQDLHDESREARETPLTKQTRDRDAADHRAFADCYDVSTYRQAIERGIEAAGVERFTPHEVRHGFVTRAAQLFGAFAASVAANHASVQTTEGYLHRDRSEAFRVVVGMEKNATRRRAKEARVG